MTNQTFIQMKQQILDALKIRFPEVAEHILSRIADKLAKTATTEDQVTTAVEGVTVQNLLDSNGDHRATEATQTSVANYEKKHGLKEGQKTATGGEPTITEPNPTDTPDDTPAWAKGLIASNKTLSDKVTAMEGEKQSDKLSSILKGRCKDVDEAFYDVAIKGRTFSSEDEVNEFAESLNTDWGAYSQKLSNEGLQRMGKPSGGASPKEGAAAIAELIEDGTKTITNQPK